MANIHILWVDDEIDILKPHIIFLTNKGYSVETCSNGVDALEAIDKQAFDVVFLDENMPGLSGLETLSQLKIKKPNLPVIMITKSEEENIMEEAIGKQITDYLIKPLNPNQILLSLKKNFDHSRLVSEQTTTNYQMAFRKIAMDLAEVNSWQEWISFYKQLIYWELQLENSDEPAMLEILENQKQEANSLFFRFIKSNYKTLLDDDDLLWSHTLLKKMILPEVKNQKTLLVVVDNLRYDQFRVLEPEINKYYKKKQEVDYFSILPTSTQYARNALFSGLMPSDMEKYYPQYWKSDFDEGGKNLYEHEFLTENIKRLRYNFKHDYYKILNLENGRKLSDNFKTIKNNDLTVVVINFVDMLSHAKTEAEIIKELANDDKAYRSLTLSWFKNTALIDMIKQAQSMGLQLILTTDHGTINCKNPTKIIGPKEISTNLRYKTGRNLNYEERDVYAVNNPKDIGLPQTAINAPFVFAKEDLFFAYPNNYNHYVKYYKNTYQHGGVSLEEMIIPCVFYDPKPL
ncbi:MAG: two-component system response regulator [Flavobacteriia bacterium]|nr:MAG: two-component system response regulator [Flavobacteriia bacterium]